MAKFQLVDLILRVLFSSVLDLIIDTRTKKNMKPRDPNPSVKTKLFFVFEHNPLVDGATNGFQQTCLVGSRSEDQYPNGWIVEQFGKGPSSPAFLNCSLTQLQLEPTGISGCHDDI